MHTALRDPDGWTAAQAHHHFFDPVEHEQWPVAKPLRKLMPLSADHQATATAPRFRDQRKGEGDGWAPEKDRRWFWES